MPENAYEEMMLIKKNFHKEDGRLGYHFIQSFNGKEVSARECNDIGMELANSLWGDKYQMLVCTHIDKDNVHNHIILNSVSFIDGSKYHNSNVEIALVREINDDLCRKYNLSVVESDKADKETDYEERTPEYYKEIDKFNKLCNELNMISDYKLTSIEDTQNLRTQYLEEISPLKAQKEIYMKLYNKTDNAADKTILKARINILNEEIDRLNSRIQTCRRIICKAEKG